MKTQAAVILALLAFLPVQARAEADQRLALFGGSGAWLDPESGFHAYYAAAYDVEKLWRGAHFGAEFNTDTARLTFDRLSIWDGRLELGAKATYEFFFAGLLIDYYRLGKKDPERGFQASYFHLETHLKATLPADNYLELAVGVRRWFIDTRTNTSEDLVLPPDAWVAEPRLRYTFWRLKHDASLRDRHRLFPRVRGIALGVEIGLDFRNETRPWGALGGTGLDPADPRNDPGDTIFFLRQWLRAGWQFHDRIRTQLSEFASYGYREDDLTRPRIGGLNPWVVPLAGAPWAAFLSEKFIALESSWHFRIWKELEIGAMFHGALLEDVERTGREDVYGFVGGMGAFVDARLWDFQVDLRAGWSPSLDWQSDSGQFSLFGSVGWQWD